MRLDANIPGLARCQSHGCGPRRTGSTSSLRGTWGGTSRHSRRPAGRSLPPLRAPNSPVVVDHLDVVAVRVEDEGRVVPVVVLRPFTRLAVAAVASCQARPRGSGVCRRHRLRTRDERSPRAHRRSRRTRPRSRSRRSCGPRSAAEGSARCLARSRCRTPWKRQRRRHVWRRDRWSQAAVRRHGHEVVVVVRSGLAARPAGAPARSRTELARFGRCSNFVGTQAARGRTVN
jgi:hypothetical protein